MVSASAETVSELSETAWIFAEVPRYGTVDLITLTQNKLTRTLSTSAPKMKIRMTACSHCTVTKFKDITKSLLVVLTQYSTLKAGLSFTLISTNCDISLEAFSSAQSCTKYLLLITASLLMNSHLSE